MTSTPSEMPHWGSFALVTYIPDPLGSFLSSLRQILPGEDNPQAHITILPPRPLPLAVETVSPQAKKILAGFAYFEVKLGRVHTFPETNILYLDIADGIAELHALHDALNTGDLAHEENFDFHPHLTLGGPLPDSDVETVREKAQILWLASGCEPRLQVTEIAALWQPPYGGWDDWNRLWLQRLARRTGRPGKAARGGN